MVSGLKFKSVTHFDLIFYIWCKILALYYSIWFSNFSQYHLLKKLPFPHCIFLLFFFFFFHILTDHLCMGLFMASLFLFHWSLYLFMLTPYCFDYYTFVIEVKSGCLIPPGLLFFLNIAWLFRIFCGSIQILVLFYFHEEFHWIGLHWTYRLVWIVQTW